MFWESLFLNYWIGSKKMYRFQCKNFLNCDKKNFYLKKKKLVTITVLQVSDN